MGREKKCYLHCLLPMSCITSAQINYEHAEDMQSVVFTTMNIAAAESDHSVCWRKTTLEISNRRYEWRMVREGILPAMRLQKKN